MSAESVEEKLKRIDELRKKVAKLTDAGRPGRKPLDPEEKAERNREANREQSRNKSLARQTIGPYPPVKNPARKESCRLDLALFCTTYLRFLFLIPFCADQLAVIAKIQHSVLHGGLFALAMPRGFGKTTIALAAALWCVLYGHRKFIILLGATAPHAVEQLRNLKFILEDPDYFADLHADFPEVCHPVRSLDGETRNQKGQRNPDGSHTEISWGGDKFIVLPTPDFECLSAGIRVQVTSVTGRVRGFNVKGRRPDFVIIDDVQTNESANSESQCEKIETVLGAAVVGLAGPGKKISGVMPCTVIREGDAADNILSHEKHPEWDSTRTQLLYSFPTNQEFWDRYREIRIGYNPNVDRDKVRAETEATEFYIDNQAAMDAGARVAWTDRFNSDEVSAIQNAMNLFIQNEYAFWAEFQNKPKRITLGRPDELTATEIAAKVNGLSCGIVPISAPRLTAFIDVQGKVLFYVVVAWEQDFTGYVVAYGTYPDQGRMYFTKADLTRTFESETKVSGLEAQIHAALTKLTTTILTVPWQVQRAADAQTAVQTCKVERCLIDSGWGESTNVVYQVCARSTHSAILAPSKGHGVGCGTSLVDRRWKPGDRHGIEWRYLLPKESRGVRLVEFDADWWKSFIHARLRVSIGNPGCLSLFSTSEHDKKQTSVGHRLFADHLTAEYREELKNETTGRTADKWHLKLGADNDYFDCLVGCAVGAQMLGVTLEGVHRSAKPPITGGVDYAAMYAASRGGK